MACMQIEGLAVQHSDVTIKMGLQTVSAVRTLWPVGVPYKDGGARAYDEVDGYVLVCGAICALCKENNLAG
jgi:hypothetical protein